MPLDDKEKAELERWRDCKCGGKFRLEMDKCGVAHTYPTCDAYEQLNLDKLISVHGALAHYLFGMEKKKAEA